MDSRYLINMIHKCRPSLSFRNSKFSSLAFVPNHNPTQEEDIHNLVDFINSSFRIFVLSGAGISTESGIPDYRSEGVGLYARSNNRPVQYKDFLKCLKIRQRYWARNFIGWPRFSSTCPNATHTTLRELDSKFKKISCIVTQNVDRLHHKAGSENVIELHGSAYEVICLNCSFRISRHDFQDILKCLNPNVGLQTDTVRPDGDVELPQELVQDFKVPNCSTCGGILKPDIVFFGDNVPRNRVDMVKNEMNKSDVVLVLGSSVSVFSGYRILLQANEMKKPIAIVNIGETRADHLVNIKISARCGDILPKVCSGLSG